MAPADDQVRQKFGPGNHSGPHLAQDGRRLECSTQLDDRGEAHLIALACSPASEGHHHWTLRLLAGKAVELGLVESLSHETVRLRLKKTHSSRGGSSSGASRE